MLEILNISVDASVSFKQQTAALANVNRTWIY